MASRSSSRSTASTQRKVLVCTHGERPVLRISVTKDNPERRFWGVSIIRKSVSSSVGLIKSKMKWTVRRRS
ncbi:hypothetical protein PIB30_040121 [Stylosanthes scabra]|uniref:Uncharacterized protein n=1 Tax=Stylosanthes scabra TaxID=79078 RepID=A0ABU6SFD7_9FABA|nr:hypothetical protein [Stylosanthes scabra]